MSLSSRQQLILFKIEDNYGVDPVPTSGANAILAKNFSITPMNAELISRDIIKPYFGNSEQLLAQYNSQVSFDVEYVGSGIVGGVPGFDEILRACAFKSEIVKVVASEFSQAGQVVTIESADHGFKVGDKVIISGALNAAHNVVQIVTAATQNEFSFQTDEVEPIDGDVEFVKSIKYKPVTNNLESGTIYFIIGAGANAVLHRITGAVGNVEINLAVKTIPSFKFTFTGLYNDPSDVANPAPATINYSAFSMPQIANTQNTPGYSLFGHSGNLESISLNMANDVQYITLIGEEKVKLLDRAPAGNIVFEAPTIGEKDFFGLVKESTTGLLELKHGTKKGCEVTLTIPRVLLGNPSYQDSNNIKMLSAPFTATPVNGNDEVEITFS